MSEKITKISDNEFEATVITTLAKTSLVFFSASWSGPSRMMRPILEQTIEKYQSKMSFYELDIDENPTTAMKYSVRNVPRLIVFRNGQEIEINGRFLRSYQRSSSINNIRRLQKFSIKTILFLSTPRE